MTKLHYAQYPSNGFGGKCDQYYLIDIFGNRYDIVDEYDTVMDERIYKVNDPGRLMGCGFDLTDYTAKSPMKLIEVLNDIERESLAITEW